MARLNVGTKTEAAVRAAKKEEIAQLEAAGEKIETGEGGEKYRVTDAFGMTVRTRID